MLLSVLDSPGQLVQELRLHLASFLSHSLYSHTQNNDMLKEMEDNLQLTVRQLIKII